MEKANQRVMLTKRLLKEGLLRLLMQEDLEKINVSELCRESGINRATFYRHYSSPRDVLVEMGADITHEIDELTRDITTLQEAREYLEEICTYLYANGDMVRLLVRYNTDTDLLNLLNDFQARLWEARGKINKLSTLDEEGHKMVATFFGGGLFFLFRRWLLGEINQTPQEIADFILRYIVRVTETKIQHAAAELDAENYK